MLAIAMLAMQTLQLGVLFLVRVATFAIVSSCIICHNSNLKCQDKVYQEQLLLLAVACA